MNAIARVESRIVDVQARFARIAGRTGLAPGPEVTPLAASAAERFDAPGTANASFREVADAALRNQALFRNVSGTSGAAALVTGSSRPLTRPKSLTGVSNGQVPDALLEPIGQGQHRLERTAAVAFRRMATAAARDGIGLRVSDSYRSLADQEKTADNVGLFGVAGYGEGPPVTISNVGLVGGSTTGRYAVGALVGNSRYAAISSRSGGRATAKNSTTNLNWVFTSASAAKIFRSTARWSMSPATLCSTIWGCVICSRRKCRCDSAPPRRKILKPPK